MPKRVDIIGIYDNQDFSAPIEYTFGLIFSTYGVSYKIMHLDQFKPEEYSLDATLVISYGTEYLDTGAKKQIHIYPSDFFGKDYLETNSMPETPLKKYDDLPVIYSGHGDFDGWVRQSENLIETNIDIIASSFFMVSRYEEVMLDVTDQYDRFPATASLAYKEGFLNRPIVNEYIELLWSWIKSLKPELARKPFWPDNKDFAVCLTHDVDVARMYTPLSVLRSVAGKILKHGKPREAVDLAVEYAKIVAGFRKDPYDTFDYIINLEKSLGCKSSFYFKADGDSEYDSGDTVRRRRMKRLVKSLEAAGCEIGLHPSFDSYDNLHMMAAEKNEMDNVVRKRPYGCRQHFVRWKTPHTWRIQEEAGLLYDTTLTFADHVGFRCGFCMPFKPFDIMENRKLTIWELPLTVMEGSLQNPSYQNLPPELAYQEIIKYINTVRKYNGLFVLLWHNSSFYPEGGWDGWKDVYERVMKYISEQNAWVTSGREIANCFSSYSASI